MGTNAHMTVAEAARVLNISEPTVRRFAKDGLLSAFRMGRWMWPTRESVARMVAQGVPERRGRKPGTVSRET